MQFDKAYKELIKGKKIRRKEWELYMHLRYIENEVKTYKGEYTHFHDKASILISVDWLVVDGDYKIITFVEALEELKNKKKITRKIWIDEKIDRFIFISDNQFTMCSAMECDFMPTWQCLIASDWEIMQ